MERQQFTCGRRHFRSHQEFMRWFEIRSAGFGPWYVPPQPSWSLTNNRHVANCKAALFPDFFHQIRAPDGLAVGYLATVPGYWSGDVQSLHTADYIDETLLMRDTKMLVLTAAYVLTVEWLRMPSLFERLATKVRAPRQAGANAVFLIAISVDPEYRKHKLPTLLIGSARQAAQRLGFDYVAAPFRPNGYGAYKAERKLAHSDALFADYCAMSTAEGLPVDPWLRNVVRHGARLLKPVSRSLCVKGSLAKFDRLRESFRPDHWYSPAPDVWECGETCTWYVDPARHLVMSVESNYWGAFDLRDQHRSTPAAVAAPPA